MNSVAIPVSIGELFDKITILEIKKEKIVNPDKLKNINNELELLLQCSIVINQNNIKEKINELKKINTLLWDVEEQIRQKDKEKTFDNEFVELAKLVYYYNDKRSEIKKQINMLTSSSIVEEKSYEKLSSNS